MVLHDSPRICHELDATFRPEPGCGHDNSEVGLGEQFVKRYGPIPTGEAMGEREGDLAVSFDQQLSGLVERFHYDPARSWFSRFAVRGASGDVVQSGSHGEVLYQGAWAQAVDS